MNMNEHSTLKEKEPERFDIALGFHPNDLYAFQEADYERLEELLKQERLAAVGEIGLDYHWEDVLPQDQKIGFIRQIKLAQKYSRPILIHMREATKDTLDILKEEGPIKGIMHCYSGSKEVALELIKSGFYISLAGRLHLKFKRSTCNSGSTSVEQTVCGNRQSLSDTASVQRQAE